MGNNSIFDELRQVEGDVVEGERRLAEQERLIIDLKRDGQSTERAEQPLETLRKDQRAFAIRIGNGFYRGFSPEPLNGSGACQR